MANIQQSSNARPPTAFDRRDPFSPLRQQIDRLFEDFSSGWPLPTLFGTAGYMPSAEFRDDDKQTIVSLELPGVDAKDVKIEADERSITVSGEKKSEAEHKDGEHYSSERSFGSFERSFTLPYAIDPAKVDARFDKGVLTLTIGKPAEAQGKSRRIAIHG